MTGTLECTRSQYDIVRKWASKSKTEREAGVNEMIDQVLSGDLPYDTLEDIKYEAKILSEMILRNNGNKTR